MNEMPLRMIGSPTASRWFVLRGHFRRHPALMWCTTAGLVGLAVAIRLALGPGYPVPFIPFYPAILVSTLLGGRKAGYLALAASLLGAGLLFEAGAGPLSGGDATVALTLFGLIALSVIEILVRQNDLADALRKREISLLQEQDALEARETQAVARLAELEALYEQAPIGLAFLDPDLKFVRINSALAQINGHSIDAHIGKCVWDLVPDLREVAEPLLRNVLDSGVPVADVDLSGQTAACPGMERHWREFFYPVISADGVARGIGILCEEVTEAKRARAREELLTREVDHRAKNLLAIVQSVVQLTNADGDVAKFKSSVLDRIQALGRVHALLTRNGWDGLALDHIIKEELAPFQGAVEVVPLPLPLMLHPGAAQAIGMILHELLTNSVKYGALSGQGRVVLAFVQEPAGTGSISMEWRETGGPPVKPVTTLGSGALGSGARGFGTRGFGTRLIHAAVTETLGGSIDYQLAPEGLHCTMLLPLRNCVMEAETALAG